MALTVLFLAASAVTVASNRSVGRKERRIFIATIVALTAISVADWFTFVTNGLFPELRPLHIVLIAFMFSLAPVLPAAIARAIFPSQRSDAIIAAAIGLHAALQVVNMFTGFIFWVDGANAYHRGTFYFIYVAAYVASGVYLVVQSIRAGRMYQSSNIATVIAILLCMFLGVAVQLAFPNMHTSWTAVAMAVMLYFAYYCDMILRCDALTKLLSRHSFDEFAANPQLPCSIIVIDVNDFKKVNDTYGHAFGDECLILVARFIWIAYGNMGRCYRTGGDEFCVIVTEHAQWARRNASTLHGLLANARRRDKRIPTVSIGAPMPVSEREGFDAALDAADQAMYSAKQAAKQKRWLSPNII